MKRRIFSVSFLSIALCASLSQAQVTQGRQRASLDDNWRFRLIDPGDSSGRYIISEWKWKLAGKEKPADDEAAVNAVAGDDHNWQGANPRKDVFEQKPGFAWFKVTLPDTPGPNRVLNFNAVDDKATVYLNGKKLFYHEGWNEQFEVPLDSVWRKGSNQLVVLVENNWGGGYIAEAALESEGIKAAGPEVPDFNDRDWRQVHVPHDFVVEGNFDPNGDCSHGFLPKGGAWYRKTFDIPPSDKGKSLWIDFDGVYRNSKVWLNGRLLGRNASGYASFRYDITNEANYGGKNILTVRVDAWGSEGWWYEGGGIYRHVWLNKADPLHVAPWGVFVSSGAKGKQTIVTARTEISNDSASDASCTIVSDILDAEGKSVLTLSSTVTVLKSSRAEATQKGRIKQPQLWDLDKPYLYRLVTRVQKEGKDVDSVETPFGIRTVRFDKDKGFFLNGKPLKLKGTCNHQDFAGVGIALSDRLFTYRIEKLKEMGSNAYRCAHNPPAAELLDVCDRLGMLVMDENRRLGDSPEILSQLESMVKRDRNHPSVILWSLCNEEPKQGGEEGRKIGETMKSLVLKHDPTRLITCAMNYGWGEGLSKVVDVQGFNYNISQYDSYRASHPDMPLFGSETASTVSTRGVYENDVKKGYVSAYDANHPEWAETAENAWKPIAERDWMAGAFVWTGFDYRGEPTPYKWPCINSHFGILDMCGFPKDNFYYYQAWWGSQPVLHILPHWNWKGREGKEIDVWVYGNCEKVELFQDAKSLGAKEMPRWGHVEWKVKYLPGALIAKGYQGGLTVSEAKVETAGERFQVGVSPYQTKLIADGEDVMPVAISVLDDQGRLVPTADEEMNFRLQGPATIAGVANGDPSSHEPDKATKRAAFNGRCMVLIQSTDKPGDIILTVQGEGMKQASVTLQSVAPGAK
jgi:beta-galactosidase